MEEKQEVTYDENTLFKVYQVLAECGIDNHGVHKDVVAVEIVNAFLNAGILFRERA